MNDEKEKLGIKIGSKTEVFWKGIKESAERAIENCNNEILIQKEILKIATEKEKVAKKKFWKL